MNKLHYNPLYEMYLSSTGLMLYKGEARALVARGEARYVRGHGPGEKMGPSA